MPAPVSLENCAREPIHTPGSIQPHGCLLVWDESPRLVGWSGNADGMLGIVAANGATPHDLHLPQSVLAAITEVRAAEEEFAGTPSHCVVAIDGRTYDVVVHRNLDRILCEFETRDWSENDISRFSIEAHRSIERLRGISSVERLLAEAAQRIRTITGFDRVMAYRFRGDHSGEVVAESRRDDLPAYLGRRYPASDIPEQARRLYTLNSLRLIADIDYAPVPVCGTDPATLDMSFGVLRSVSPIHVEYLRNMGVRASMSISIVIEGRLWGLIACHHMAPYRVPYTLRMACEVFSQVLASAVQTLLLREKAARTAQVGQIRSVLLEQLQIESDATVAIMRQASELVRALNAHALVVSHFGRVQVHGDVPVELAAKIVAGLGADTLGSQVVRHRRDQWPAELQEVIGCWVGSLAAGFDPAANGWLIALRREQIETVRWAGPPDEPIQTGPLGDRLSPRGSFDEWKQLVRDSAEDWSDVELEVASQIASDLVRHAGVRHAENERARTQLLAILGHDLRDPLQSINMAAYVMKSRGVSPDLSGRILSTSDRMKNLVSHVLDLSRISAGIGLGLQRARTDVSGLVDDLVDERRLGAPDLEIRLKVERAVHADIDAQRISQVVANLLGNARHHGTPGSPILVELAAEGAGLLLRISNVAPPISEAVASQLFTAFKQRDAGQSKGLGLGLYIAHQIVSAHGGELSYRYAAPHVVFEMRLPG